MAKEFKTLMNVVELPHKYAVGKTFTRFYKGLEEKKIFGTRCPSCNKVFVPARSFCPVCQVDAPEWIEVSQQGQVVSWTYSDKPYFGAPAEPPVITALIRLAGADCDFLHLIGGFDMSDMARVRETVKNGIKVRAVWREERHGHMLDIKYFEPVS
jgi:uncharacterized OB-fold protein